MAAATFKQRDVTRAVKAVMAGGLRVREVEIKPDGCVRVICNDGDEYESTANSMDKALGL